MAPRGRRKATRCETNSTDASCRGVIGSTVFFHLLFLLRQLPPLLKLACNSENLATAVLPALAHNQFLSARSRLSTTHIVDGAADAGDGHDPVRLCRENDLLLLLDGGDFLGRGLQHLHRCRYRRKQNETRDKKISERSVGDMKQGIKWWLTGLLGVRTTAPNRTITRRRALEKRSKTVLASTIP